MLTCCSSFALQRMADSAVASMKPGPPHSSFSGHTGFFDGTRFPSDRRPLRVANMQLALDAFARAGLPLQVCIWASCAALKAGRLHMVVITCLDKLAVFSITLTLRSMPSSCREHLAVLHGAAATAHWLLATLSMVTAR